LAYFDGGHGFMYQQHKRFAETVNAFMRWAKLDIH
jgi:surfactin synthase thioesterase subunit